MERNPLLEQFIVESREILQGVSEKLMALEAQPDNEALIHEVFRLVHTLKGNSGLFDFPDMTKVLHASEDLLSALRDGRLAFTQELSDVLLEAMDFVSAMLDEIERSGTLSADYAPKASELSRELRELIPKEDSPSTEDKGTKKDEAIKREAPPLPDLPESKRMEIFKAAPPDVPLYRVLYFPEPECFYKGEDPFYLIRNTPGIAWGRAFMTEKPPPLEDLDCYRCQVMFDALLRAPKESIVEHFRYVLDQVVIQEVPLVSLIVPEGEPNGGPIYEDFVKEALEYLDSDNLDKLRAACDAMLEISSPTLWISSALRWLRLIIDVAPNQKVVMRKLIESLNTLKAPQWTPSDWVGSKAEAPKESSSKTTDTPKDKGLANAVMKAQIEALEAIQGKPFSKGHLLACAESVRGVFSYLSLPQEDLEDALNESLSKGDSGVFLEWLRNLYGELFSDVQESQAQEATKPEKADTPKEREPVAVHRTTEFQTTKFLRVDQTKIDRLMDLAGELVVAKNALPYLAKKAEEVFGVRELAREIKAHYGVINRIAEELQDAVMQLRMVSMSFVFQRFPKLVRDLSRKLGKQVELIIEGEETEADKNVIEALSEPLVHLIRNSIDHGIESPEDRVTLDKPKTGKIILRAKQESNNIVIEVSDDGRGIDPEKIKMKAYQKGLIDEDTLDRLSEKEAMKLIFLPGFSTKEEVSDVSGRGVGMDAVKATVEKLGGSVSISSVVNKGTTVSLTLPISMAVTRVMLVEAGALEFGVPMDYIVETVRLPVSEIFQIKDRKVAVLRGMVVPILSLNELLQLHSEPVPNANNEFAVLVVNIGGERVGIVVDGFHEVIDVILKPLTGELAKLSIYAGSAILGDGSVLLIINPKELLG